MGLVVVLKGVGLALAACCLGHALALEEDPPCAIHGLGYNDPKRNSTPNGGYPNSSVLCQDRCVNEVYCEKFTYYNNTKGCWLQGNHDDTIIKSPYVISGPVRCPEIAGGWGSPHALSAGELAIWNKVAAGDVTYESDDLKATAKQLDLASSGVPDSVSTQVVAGTNYKFQFPDKKEVTVYKSLADDLKLTNIVKNKEFTLVDKQSQVDGGFPWLILLLVLLALLALGAFAWYFMGGTSEKKTKKKKSAKAQPTAARELEEGAPLMAPAAAATPPPVASFNVPLTGLAMPMQYRQAATRDMMMSGAQVASSVAYPGAQVASPVYSPSVLAPAMAAAAPLQYSYQQTSSQQVMVPVAQPSQAPMQMVNPAASDLFNRFDTDGDGRLSRAEMEAGMASLQR